MMSRISIVVSSAVVSSKSASAMSFLWLEVQACIFSPVFFFVFCLGGGGGYCYCFSIFSNSAWHRSLLLGSVCVKYLKFASLRDQQACCII